MPAPRDHDDYLAHVPEPQRAVLEGIRQAMAAAAPASEECISYGLPAFRQDGRAIAAYGSARGHVAIYPMSTAVMEQFAGQVKGMEHSKGTLRFPADKPVPAALVKRIIKARLAENTALAAERKRPATAAKKAAKKPAKKPAKKAPKKAANRAAKKPARKAGAR